MNRLTINKPVEEMGMCELAQNCCYIGKDGEARYRNFETDIDARDLARNLMVVFEQWKSMEYGLDADNELVDDDIFDDSMLEYLSEDITTMKGLIALFYRNLWAMAELRERLKYYEDLVEQGRFSEIPCKIGDDVEKGCSMSDLISRRQAICAISNYHKLKLDKGVTSVLKENKELCNKIREIPAADAQFAEWLKEMQEYKALEEQGLLAKLPCAVGDTVWELCKCYDGKYRTFRMTVAIVVPYGSIRWVKGKEPTVWNVYATSGYTYMYKSFYDIGKTVFLTKAEAEQKLEEVEN